MFSNVREVDPVKENAAVRGRDETEYEIEERRLAATRRAENRDDFPLFDRKGNVGENRAVAVCLGDVLKFEHGRVSCQIRSVDYLQRKCQFYDVHVNIS